MTRMLNSRVAKASSPRIKVTRGNDDYSTVQVFCTAAFRRDITLYITIEVQSFPHYWAFRQLRINNIHVALSLLYWL